MIASKHHLRVALTLLTITYLIFELSFAGRLLDVMGSQFNEDIHGIEVYGRIFSGVAIGLLFFWKIFDNFWWSNFRKVMTFGVVITGSIGLVWFLQTAILHYVESSFSNDQKKELYLLSLSAGMVASNEIQLPGISTDVANNNPGAFKTLVAIYPYLYHKDQSKLQVTATQQDKILTYQVASSCEFSESNTKCLGSRKDFFQHRWMPARKKIISEIESKLQELDNAGSESELVKYRAEAIGVIDEAVRSKTHMGIDQIKKSWFRNKYQQTMVKEFKPYLKANWNPDDDRLLRDAYAFKKRDEIVSEAKRLFKAKAPKNMTVEWIFDQPETQQRINVELGIIREENSLDPKTYKPVKIVSKSELAKAIRFPYNLIKEGPASDDLYIKILKSYKSRLSPSDVNNIDYNKALDRMVFPIIALLFSMVGSVLHIIKLTVILVGFKVNSIYPKVALMISLLLVFALVPYFANNAVTRNEEYARSRRYIAESGGEWDGQLGYAVHWLINTQNLLYPFNNMLRMHVLRDIQFERIEIKAN